jgi:dynein heavy chain
VQVDPIKPMLKPPGTKRLKAVCDIMLSTSAFKFNLRRYSKAGEKSRSVPVNPKAVTRNELYGCLHPSTREWKEGLMSVNFRDMSNNKTFQHQW